MWKLVAGLVAFRVFNALFVRTYFNPDEFWQSSEVAHHMVFGYGYLYTGESKRRDDLVESSSMTTKQQTRKAFAFAALGCIFRPTNAVLWAFLTATLVVQTKSKLALLFHTIVPVGVLAISLMLVVDRIGYGEWTCVPWNFVKFNVLEGKDKLYGVHPWYWYFVAGYPEITAMHLPLILFEPRFLLPLLPASFVYAGKALHYLEKRTFFKPLLGLLILLNGIAAVEREAGSPSDALRQDPLAFATARYKSHPLPTYIVVYSSGASALHNSLAIWKFALQKQFDHSTLSLDADSPVADTHMLVYSNQMISP
ncbi:hypothetical protein DYB36_008543 [Aphanomyces astaci]|uniref:Mannosyltransferase n=1 Tax=Aphanomyces astaci TaxID=112090 RepID=A0A397ANS8_APHAT|nr:hypothetical protein DYB36_008543 [Aphanomyces astaci]